MSQRPQGYPDGTLRTQFHRNVRLDEKTLIFLCAKRVIFSRVIVGGPKNKSELRGMSEREIFIEAIQRTDRSALNAFLDETCGIDSPLRARVEVLMAAHQGQDPLLNRRASALLQASLPGSDSSGDSTAEHQSAPDPEFRSGDWAGNYQLLEKIGEGGMGEVWVAQQSQPIKRKVALKVLKPGMDSRVVLARFEAERQALALMDHPNIAKVFDSGMTPTGRPYFVMELVNGLPLTKFCDEARLTPRERLLLFVPICQAVQHAHTKGIIHRDLKPANVLVTLIDGKPVPRVIDFGVAKATGKELTEESLSTQFGTIVGTLEYMSPEQAGYSGVDIDTRTDVYSLGVILYELITGLRPMDFRRTGGSLPQAIRVLHDDEPTTPSSRLSTCESLPSLAGLRRTEPKRLMAMLRGDLDWVVMKCLEKQRDRRYETADSLARDIQRFLANEPVEAMPPSSVYRFKKFLDRHWGRVVAAGLVLLAMIGGVIGTTIGLLNANAAHEAERLARNGEQAANKEIRKRLAQVEKANELLASIFQDLDPAEIDKQDRPLRAILAEKLDFALEHLEDDSIGDPYYVAVLQRRLGQSLLALGAGKKAIRPLEKSLATHKSILGLDHPKTLLTLTILGAAYRTEYDWARALPLFIEAYERTEAARGPNDDETLSKLDALAAVYHESGRLDLAIPLFEQVCRRGKDLLGSDNPVTLNAMHNFAAAYITAGKAELAIPLLEETLRLKRAKYKSDSCELLATLDSLATCYQRIGKSDQALTTQQEAVRLADAQLGPDHVHRLGMLSTMGWICYRQKLFDKAISYYEEVARRFEAKLGRLHYNTQFARANLGSNYLGAGRTDEALPLLEEVYEAAKRHPRLHDFDQVLCRCYCRAGMMDKAAALAKERGFPLPEITPAKK